MIIFVAIGGFCGLIVALIFRRQPLLVVVALSAAVGTAAQGLLGFIGEASTDYREHGYTLIRAIEAGLGMAVLLGMSAPVTAGLPAAFFGYVCHRLFHAVGKKPSA